MDPVVAAIESNAEETIQFFTNLGLRDELAQGLYNTAASDSPFSSKSASG
jgi:hypothetical protein